MFVMVKEGSAMIYIHNSLARTVEDTVAIVRRGGHLVWSCPNRTATFICINVLII